MINYKKYMRVKDKDKAHAELGASGSERWLNCSACIQEARKYPPQKDNEFSIAGTNAHTLMEFIFREGEAAVSFKESKNFREFIGYSPEQHDAVMVAIRFVIKERKRLFKKYGVKPTLLVEQKVKLPGVGFGTSDVILFIPGVVLHVMDFKNGQSVVHPENNSQGLYYAVAFAKKYDFDFKKVSITIMQPNAAHSRGPIRTWHTDMSTLEEWDEIFIKGAKIALGKKPVFKTDAKWCYFCPAKRGCLEYNKKHHEKVLKRF